jgi:hypothetical protein
LIEVVEKNIESFKVVLFVQEVHKLSFIRGGVASSFFEELRTVKEGVQQGESIQKERPVYLVSLYDSRIGDWRWIIRWVEGMEEELGQILAVLHL